MNGDESTENKGWIPLPSPPLPVPPTPSSRNHLPSTGITGIRGLVCFIPHLLSLITKAAWSLREPGKQRPQ